MNYKSSDVISVEKSSPPKLQKVWDRRNTTAAQHPQAAGAYSP